MQNLITEFCYKCRRLRGLMHLTLDKEKDDWMCKEDCKEFQKPQRGGKRSGAGRPKGSTKPPTKSIRLPLDMAEWFENKENIEKVRELIKCQK